MEGEQEKSFLDGTNSKVAFYFGLAVGIGGMCLLGLLIVLGGLFGWFNVKAVRGVEGNAQPSVQVQQPQQPQAPSAPVKVDIKNDDHIRGAKNAPVTIVEYSDFQCPFCSRFHPEMLKVMSAYQNKVRWVFRHFPLTQIHPNAQKAAEASECASEQGKFWEFADKLFANQEQLGPALYDKLAKDLNLNATKFSSCLSNGKYAKKVQDSEAEGAQLGVQGTPGNFINGQVVPGALPFEQLKSIIDAQLAA